MMLFNIFYCAISSKSCLIFFFFYVIFLFNHVDRIIWDIFIRRNRFRNLFFVIFPCLLKFFKNNVYS